MEFIVPVKGMRYICIYYMASSASGQYAANSVFWLATRAGKMERYCPPGTARFVPANKISPKFKRVHESFLSMKLLSSKVKRFFVISLSLWNQKKRQREWKQRKQKSTEDMILALAGQFKQLSHEPEKFRWLNGNDSGDSTGFESRWVTWIFQVHETIA